MTLFNVILIRFGELTLKSKGIRSIYEKNIFLQVKDFFKKENIKYSKIRAELGRIFIHYDNIINEDNNINKSINILTHIFGIYSISLCKSCSSNINDILESCYLIGKKYLKNNETFAVSVKKSCNYIYNSQEISKICGDSIWKALEENGFNPKVNLSNPDKKINIEIRNRETYIFFYKINGLGGLPSNTQGKMISLISGGIDSPVASWLMMKRGIEIIPLYFDSGKYCSKNTIDKVTENLKILFSYSRTKKHLLYKINYESYMDLVVNNCSEKNRCILCKRFMFYIANELRKYLRADGIITGSSIGQVASQTSKNMLSEIYNLSLPLYHPLIGYDKQEIINIAKIIGTYNISIRKINEDECKAVPRKPEIKAKENDSVLEEEKINENILNDIKEKILKSYEIIIVK